MVCGGTKFDRKYSVLTIEEDVLKAADELAMKVAKEGDEAEALARMQYQNNNKYRYVYSSGDMRDILQSFH